MALDVLSSLLGGPLLCEIGSDPCHGVAFDIKIVGCVSFLVAGAVCLIVFYSIRKIMPGAGKAAFEGVLTVMACAVLTHISLKFLRLKDRILEWANSCRINRATL